MFGAHSEVYRLLFKSSTAIAEVAESLRAVSRGTPGVDLTDEIEKLERSREHLQLIMGVDEQVDALLERTFRGP